MQISDITAQVQSLVRADNGILQPGDYTRYAQQAVTGRYSQDRPLEVVTDVPGNGTYLLPLPTPPAGVEALWERDFSQIETIEYPVGEQPPQYIDTNDYDEFYRTPAGDQLQLYVDCPPATDTLRIVWTSRHAIDASTVPQRDFYAVCDLAGSFAMQEIANYFLREGDSTIGADSVNYRSKGQEAAARGRELFRRYCAGLGVTDSPANGGSEAKAAFAVGQQYEDMNSGTERLTHSRYNR